MQTTYLAVSQTQIRLEYWIEHCIMAVVFFLPLSLDVTSFFLSAGGALWLLQVIVKRRIDFRKTPCDLAIALFVLLAAASITASPDSNFSYYNYYHLMGRYILLYYLVVNHLHSGQQFKRLLQTVLVSAAVVVLYGFYQYFCGGDISLAEWVDGQQFPELKVRVFSTLGNPNLLAGFLVAVMALAGGLGLYSEQRRLQLALFALTAIFAVCLALTYCRGAWLSLAAVVVIFGKMYSKKFFWLFLLLPLLVLVAPDLIWERLTSILNPTDTSAALRLALWESTWAMIVEHPLLGIGWGAYWLVYPEYDFFINDSTVLICHAHNSYLHLAAEIGIPGLLAFLVCCGQHMKMAVAVLHSKSERYLAGLALGFIGAMTGMAVIALTDHILFSIQISMFFWLLCSLITAAWLNLQPKVKYYGYRQ